MQKSIGKLPQKITLEAIHLRLLKPEDADDFYKMTNVPEIATIISFLSYPVDWAFAHQWIGKNESNTERVYGIFVNETLIGNMGVHLNQENEAEIGYWINPQYTGKGIASLALREIINAIKSTYPDYKIFAECLPSNGGSLRVLEKCGFILSPKSGERKNRIRLDYV